jgi:hypothetical protein
LTVNGVSYRVRPVACDHEAAEKCFELRKSSGERYHVSRHGSEGCRCSCPDFVFSRDGRDSGGCKHIRALVVLGLLAPTPVRDPHGAPARPVREHGHGQPPSARYTEHDNRPGRDTWRSGGHDA